MKVRMKEDKQAAPDGINIIDYKKGRTYDMPEELAKEFIKQGVVAAVKPKEVKVEEPDETKVIEPEETKKEEATKDEKPPETKEKK